MTLNGVSEGIVEADLILNLILLNRGVHRHTDLAIILKSEFHQATLLLFEMKDCME